MNTAHRYGICVLVLAVGLIIGSGVLVGPKTGRAKNTKSSLPDSSVGSDEIDPVQLEKMRTREYEHVDPIQPVYEAGQIPEDAVVTLKINLDLKRLAAQVNKVRTECWVSLGIFDQDNDPVNWVESIKVADVPVSSNRGVNRTVYLSFVEDDEVMTRRSIPIDVNRFSDDFGEYYDVSQKYKYKCRLKLANGSGRWHRPDNKPMTPYWRQAANGTEFIPRIESDWIPIEN